MIDLTIEGMCRSPEMIYRMIPIQYMQSIRKIFILHFLEPHGSISKYDYFGGSVASFCNDTIVKHLLERLYAFANRTNKSFFFDGNPPTPLLVFL